MLCGAGHAGMDGSSENGHNDLSQNQDNDDEFQCVALSGPDAVAEQLVEVRNDVEFARNGSLPVR
jgi:hypothetical protein